jgi:hypothetical protein
MQTPVRFYITQSDDQPVVHTVPVAIRHPVPVVESTTRHVSEPTNLTNAPTTSEAPRRARLSKIVRAATHRTHTRH